MKNSDVVLPVYYKIALDIASGIASGKYEEGRRIFARSEIAAHYSVSPETARRAISVLADLEIVKAEKGSGVTICSTENASAFIKTATDAGTAGSLKTDILENLARQSEELASLERQINQLFDSTDRFRDTNPFVPFSIEIDETTPYLMKSAAETQFWYMTTATIIAIKRGDNIIISPGPYAVFEKGDIVFFIGDEDTYEKVRRFLYPKK